MTAVEALHEIYEKYYSNLPSGKAPGPDGIIMEMLKSSTEVISPLLTVLFNVILDSGNYPKEWSKALILPLHKKGPKADPNNYRGISLSSVISKVFMKVLVIRLTLWADREFIKRRTMWI